jgi:tRNA A37 threonylcarbamoyladenosine dehydratase
VPEPLPEPADLDRRFGGLARLYGVSGAARIRAAHVVVVGVGGVGSWTVEALARSGVGRLTLIDLDNVAESNINRQIHALDDTVGMAKVEAMRQRIAHINPDCVVTCHEEFVEPSNWPSILNGADVDAVVDACDQVKAKTAMAAWAIHHKVLFITVGAAGGKRFAHKVDIDDLCNTSHDPLLAKLRYNLRREHGAARDGKKMGVACVFSREAVASPDASCDVQGDGSLNCSGFGSVVSVTATFGQCASGWVFDQISSRPLPKH